jgi:D-alanyl-D-alanine carboxypeptidase
MRTLVITVALTLNLWGQSAPLKTPPGIAFDAWLNAFNSGDRSRVEAYLAKYEPKHKEMAERMLDLQSRVGGFDLIKIESVEGLRLEALVKERTGGNYAQVSLELADAATMEIMQMEVRLVPPPMETPSAARMTPVEGLKALEGRASDLAGRDKFSGALLVATNGNIQLEKAYGLADRERKQANTVDTRFRIGSMNKMFTATAILQLVGQGKIDLAAPVGKYLKAYPNAEVANKVTVRHLLTHTGGTGDIFTPEYEQRRLEIRDPKDYIRLFGSRGIEFEPGTKWAYSNYGFILLGAIIESVSGVPYYEYVRKNIFLPAGMTSTDSLPETELSSQVSKGYLLKGNAWASNADTLPARGTPAGGGYSTTRDLYRFAEALLSGKLLPAALLQQMTTRQAAAPQMPPGASYGFGMNVSENPRRIGHGGGAPGMNGELRIYPASKTIVVVLANLDPPVATQLAAYYEQIMPLP